MIKLNELLLEGYVNLFDNSEKLKYADEVWKILQLTYKSMGGYKGASSTEELVNDSGLWKMVRKGGKIVAIRIYKDKHGRKAIASGTNGTPLGKKWLLTIYKEDVDFNRSWGEVSGKLADILINKYKAQPLPNIYAEKLLGKKILKLNPDGFHYTRLIANKPYEKIILVGDVQSFLSKVDGE